jgi:2-octaprenyl-6-methoxyphenol hydroxylase
LAFLPISKKNTSIVYSVKGDRNIRLQNLINKYNLKYKIIKMNKPDCFELKSMGMRSYYYKNILAFGDLLHKLHPLAGQGFNMSIRDINELSKIIRKKISLGLDLDSSIFHEFEKKTKHKNYLFSNGIDLIYEFFNFENRINSQVISKSIKFLNNNKLLNKFIIKSADEGIII